MTTARPEEQTSLAGQEKQEMCVAGQAFGNAAQGESL
jgi:hypothetical protein